MATDNESDTEGMLAECDECGEMVLPVYLEDGTCDECRNG